MFWNIAHMKGSSFHTHITLCPRPLLPPLCLMQLGPRVACHVVKYLKFMCYIRHLFSFLFFLFFTTVWHFNCCAWVSRGVGEVCQSKYSRKMLGIAGEIPLFLRPCSELAIDFYCKSVRVLCFSAVVVVVFSRKPFYVEKKCTCVCVGVCIYSLVMLG